ncbi:MAG: carboxypeptidase regulatory-like domain-containing protein [Gemmatimonas sp.]
MNWNRLNSALALVLMGWGIGLGAQTIPAAPAAPASAGIIHGVVMNEAGRALPYAVVSIESRNLQQFANTSGRFQFVKLPAGKYRISVRQLGYQPASVDVVLANDGSADVSVRMQRVAVRLAAMHVSDDWVCRATGVPTKAKSDPALVTVFEQLEQGAVRLQLLLNEFPYRVLTERRRLFESDGGADSVAGFDTTLVDGNNKPRYKVGNVVERTDFDNRPSEYVLQVPTLLDFAQPEFQKSHCFILRGLEDRDGRTLIRVDFKASAKISEPDVEGSVFLDPNSYKLRRSEIELTRIPLGLTGLMAFKVTTNFDEIAAGMPMIVSMRSVGRMLTISRAAFQRKIEVHSALRVDFLRDVPAPVAADSSSIRPQSVPPD